MPSAKVFLQNAVTATLVVCALIVTWSVLHREFFQSDGTEQIGTVSEWKEIAADRPPYFGSKTAPVQIFVFSDYQCPFCKDLDGKLDQLASDENLGFSLRRYESPLVQVHRYAYYAALAGKCAGAQGATRNFQREVFAHADHLATLDWELTARTAGVPNPSMFLNCLQDKRSVSALKKDMDLSDKLGITGVPVFVINGDMYSGTRSEAQLRQLIIKAGSRPSSS